MIEHIRDARRRFPDFLIIGAMKSGTTTLYWDLASNPAIEFPIDKEVNNLASDAVLTSSGRDEYSALFSHVEPGQICGDASTSYTMRPDFEGVAGRSESVPARTHAVIGENLRILYIVRDPIERIISHHYHDYRRGRASAQIDEEVRSKPRYIDCSRYAYQARPWVDVFGQRRFRAIDFHHYMSDRPATTEAIEAFLGIETGPPDRGTEIFNKGDTTRTQLNRFWTTVAASRPYQWARPKLSPAVRRRMRNLLLPAPKVRPEYPSQETFEFLIDTLRDDIEQQPSLFGWEAVRWSPEDLWKKYLGR